MIVYYDDLGQITNIASREIITDEEFIEVLYEIDPFTFGVKNYVNLSTNTIVPKPERPSIHHEFDYMTHTWVDNRNIDDVKAAKRKYINEQRLLANQTSFTFNDKEIATDMLSRSDIDGVNGEVALTNSLPASFPNVWKAIDNTYVSIPDVGTWTSFYKAMVNKGTDNFMHAQELKLAVEQASTIQEVESIIW